MSKIYLHNSTYGSRDEALLAWDEPKHELQAVPFWNIWPRPGVGSAIEDGTRILLVGSWPEAGGTVRHLLWDARAWDVHKWDGVDWETAVRLLGRWSGAGAAAVRANRYMAAKQSAGVPFFVMGWRPDVVQWINRPLPTGVRVNGNGWAAFDESEVAKWKVLSDPRKGGRGQGRRLDVASRDAVEDRAMAVARKWCVDAGWTEIEDTSKGRPWDYEADDATGRHRYIEVKGTTGGAYSFEVTDGEVKSAEAHGKAHLLIAVSGIKLASRANDRITASGGEVRVYNPWSPQKSELRETRYIWTPGGRRTT